MNHFIIKLASGEFVYGMIDEDTVSSKMLVVNNPLTWEEYINEDGMSSSTLTKFCTGSDEEDVPINSSHVVSITAMSPTFARFYDSAVALQKIIEPSYNSKLEAMTNRMFSAVSDHYAKQVQQETGGIVAYYPYPEDSDNTIH
jgi:hypothetical protein